MSESLQPTQAKDRIVFLDVLRGFALVGILFANILSWSGLKFLPFDHIIALGNFEIDRELYHEMKFFVDTKFYTLFSLLFGVGFYMQLSKNRDNPTFVSMYLRRLSLLLVIGVIHAVFWSGDILTLYAIMGMVLLSLRKVPPARLLPLAFTLYFLPILLDVVYMQTFALHLPEKAALALKVYPDMSPQEVVAGFQSGSVVQTFFTNLHNLMWRWYDFIPTGRPLKVLGLFLLGSFLYHIKFFTNHALRWKYLLIFLSLGLVFTILSMQMKGSITHFSKSWMDVIYRLVHEIGQVSLGLSYICILARLQKRWSGFVVFDWLKNYGRMSLTSYLGHTFFGIIVFYPLIGWAFFGRVSLQTTYCYALLILAIQLVFSNVWFVYFRYGPVEWIWRCATYGSRIRILK